MVRSGPLKYDHYPQTQKQPIKLSMQEPLRDILGVWEDFTINAEVRAHERRHQTTIRRVSSFTPFCQIHSIFVQPSWTHEGQQTVRWETKMRVQTALPGAQLMLHTKGKEAVFPPLCKSREGLEYWPKARMQSEVLEHTAWPATAATAAAAGRAA